MWIQVMDTRTNEVLETGLVSAMTMFDDLPADFHVWCANGNGDAVVIPRHQLVRIDGGELAS